MHCIQMLQRWKPQNLNKIQNGNSIPSHPVMPTHTHTYTGTFPTHSQDLSVWPIRGIQEAASPHAPNSQTSQTEKVSSDIWEDQERKSERTVGSITLTSWTKSLPTVSCSSLIGNMWLADLCVWLYQLVVHYDLAHKNLFVSDLIILTKHEIHLMPILWWNYSKLIKISNEVHVLNFYVNAEGPMLRDLRFCVSCRITGCTCFKWFLSSFDRGVRQIKHVFPPTLLSGREQGRKRCVYLCAHVCVRARCHTSTAETVGKMHSMGVDGFQEIPLPFPQDLIHTCKNKYSDK